jgi:hypothetical protein
LILESTTPRNNGPASTIDPIIFRYNKDLDPKTADNFVLEPHTEGKLEVVGNILKYTPTLPYVFDRQYVARLNGARSLDGKTAGAVTITFRPGFVAVGNLSKEQLQAQAERTDRVEKEFPILKYIPHETLHYKIDYDLTANQGYDQPLNQLTVTITLFANLTREEQRASYQQELVEYKKEALDYLKSKGINPADYTIRYIP